MAETTGIAWCDSTWNPWIGCTKVGPGCDHCYASVSTPARSLGVVWGAGQPRRRTSEANWKKPLRWQKLAERGLLPDGKTPTNGRRPRVFCASLADVFDNEVNPIWRWDLFDLIRATPALDWLLLTKRVGNVKNMMILGDSGEGGRSLPPNVWLGATIVNQEEADRDIPKLLATPAAKRFVSYEPALGPVDWRPFLGLQCDNGSVPGPHPGGGVTCPRCDGVSWPGCSGLDWIIVGGESAQPGHPARPFDIQWARDTVRQCRASGVAVFVKQMGSRVRVSGDAQDALQEQLGAHRMERMPECDGDWRVVLADRAGADPAEWPEDLRVREFPDAVARAA